MSQNVEKLSVRVELQYLEGNSIKESYTYFKRNLGEPDEVFPSEENVEEFRYEDREDKIVPVSDGEGKWGVEYIIYKGDGLNKSHTISLGRLYNIVEEIRDKLDWFDFDIDYSRYKVVVNSWYNGVGEPIEF